jgi:hypothetical protein
MAVTLSVSWQRILLYLFLKNSPPDNPVALIVLLHATGTSKCKDDCHVTEVLFVQFFSSWLLISRSIQLKRSVVDGNKGVWSGS